MFRTTPRAILYCLLLASGSTIGSIITITVEGQVDIAASDTLHINAIEFAGPVPAIFGPSLVAGRQAIP